MSRRCLICSNINPCRKHSDGEQQSALHQNMREVASIESASGSDEYTHGVGCGCDWCWKEATAPELAQENSNLPCIDEIAAVIDHGAFREGDVGGLRKIKRERARHIARRVLDRIQERMSATCEPMHPGEDGWCEWIHPNPGFLFQCCDCKLIHEMEFAIVPNAEGGPLNEGESDAGVIVFRARRKEGGV